MAIPIRFFTAVFHVSALERRYPGGLAAYLAAHPDEPCDDTLVGIYAMSGAEVELVLDELARHDITLGRDVAVGWCMANSIRHMGSRSQASRSTGAPS